MVREIRSFAADEDAVGVVEIILIIVDADRTGYYFQGSAHESRQEYPVQDRKTE